MWYLNFFLCLRNQPPIARMTYDPPNSFLFGIILSFILLNVYLLFVVIGVCKFEHRLKSTMDLLTDGSRNLFRLVSKINGRLRVSSRPDLRKFIYQQFQRQTILFVICRQKVLVL